MKQTKLFKILSFVLAFMLIAAMALFGAGCNDNTTTEPSSITESGSETSANQNVLGEGKTSFTLNITFKDGSEKTYTINTNKTIVGEALTELGLISGTVGDYGLMVETVDGETVKYEDDGKYWAFYINGEYAMSGVDTTDITAGASYALKVE
ncbi:MAG: DUF4430 domain-containing protein [Clostridia bacterium]|nr:DUF4430 domain-containing protein [Clostridia bacterium]